MNHPDPSPKAAGAPENQGMETATQGNPAHPPATTAPPTPGPTDTKLPPKPLTPEEQMALYEDDLKENDWGHQPC